MSCCKDNFEIVIPKHGGVTPQLLSEIYDITEEHASSWIALNGLIGEDITLTVTEEDAIRMSMELVRKSIPHQMRKKEQLIK